MTKLHVFTDTRVERDLLPRVAYYIIDDFTHDVWAHATTIHNERYRNGTMTNSILGEVLAFEFVLNSDQLKNAEEIVFYVDNVNVRDWIRGTVQVKRKNELINEVIERIHLALKTLRASYTIEMDRVYGYGNLAHFMLKIRTNKQVVLKV